MISADVTGSAIWGNGTGRYAVYKIDITYKNDTWTVYRRYSEFFKLHNKLLDNDSHNMASLVEIFPERGSMGSIVNSLEPNVKERTIAFQRYIQALLALPDITDNEIVMEFFDTKFKGCSGFRKSIGASGIWKECYAQISLGTFDFMHIYVWKTAYIGLTKRGVLYVFRSMYDTPDQATIRIDLRSVDARVGGDVLGRCVNVSNGDAKVFIKFSTIDEFSSWLRQVSDFGVNAAAHAPTVSSAREANRQAAPTTSAPPPKEIKAKGTGNTNDEFSAMYGM